MYRIAEEGSIRTKRDERGSNNSNTRASQHSTKNSDHLDIPTSTEGGTEPAEDKKASVLFNKYALEKEGFNTDADIPGVHPQRKSEKSATKP